MTSRVTLISPAMGPSLRQARFDDGTTSLDDDGTAQARAASGVLRPAVRVVTSPSVRCQQTTAALGLAAGESPTELAGLQVGRWQGLTLAEVSRSEPEAVALWLGDPDSAPHGGESVRKLCSRIGQWLDTTSHMDGHTLAVVEPDIVRAMVVYVLGAPAEAFWRVDVAPLTATEITGQAGRWNLRMGHALQVASSR
ncbi:histidine phosphatase family protein [Streptomyces griseofuscus]|uniref:histidine phosphatase family protein n=1 Tax=Streptomyces griseofuscus TaxID=146922 RepID=UPI0036AA06F7